MTRIVIATAAGAVLAAMTLMTSCVSDDRNSVTDRVPAPSAASVKAKPEQIYLLRGFAGVFSLGLNQIASKLREKGIEAHVLQHSSWRRSAGQIREAFKANPKSGPVVLVGHSLGAQAIGPLALELEKSDITVDFLASIDPAWQVTIPNNVKLAWHVRVSSVETEGLLKAASGFRGKIVDFDVGERKNLKNTNINHFNIDKIEGVQDELIKQIVREVRRRRRLR